MRRLAWFGLGSGVLAIAGFVASGCVGDSVISTPANDAATNADAATEAAPPTCDKPTTVCGDKCVTTATDGKNCGTCGHDCGGGMCTDGICQPMAIRQNLDPNLTLAVNGEGVYFASSMDPQFRIQKCPLDGCTQAPATFGAMINTIDALEATTGTVIFLSSNQSTKQRPSLYYCTNAGCPVAATVISGQQIDTDGLGSLYDLVVYGDDLYWGHQNAKAWKHSACDSATCAGPDIQQTNVPFPAAALHASDASGSYYIDGLAIKRCPVAGACTPTETAIPISVNMLRPGGGKMLLLHTGVTPNLDGTISACATPDCLGGPLPVITKLAFPTTMVATATDVVWYADDLKKLQTCTIATCVPRDLVGNLGTVGFTQLHAFGKFAYWVQQGAAAGSASVWRIAL